MSLEETFNNARHGCILPGVLHYYSAKRVYRFVAVYAREELDIPLEEYAERFKKNYTGHEDYFYTSLYYHLRDKLITYVIQDVISHETRLVSEGVLKREFTQILPENIDSYLKVKNV